MEMGTTTRDFGRVVRMSITDIVKYILKHIIEPLNRPVTQLVKDYD